VESGNEIEFVDSHCHLNFDLFDDDRDAVVENARRNGIHRILNPGIDIETSKSAIEIAHTYPEVFAAIGVHPNQGSTWNEYSLPELRDWQTDMVAAGENRWIIVATYSGNVQ
jgi:TatD DNase family protein